MNSIRPFAVAAGISLASILGASVAGNVVYGGQAAVRWTPGRVALAALVFGGLVCFTYSLVPVLVRAFLKAQLAIGNGEAGPVRWLAGHERTVWLTVWIIWTLGLIIALPFAIHDWRRETGPAPAPVSPP